MDKRPCGLYNSDTITDALRRADYASHSNGFSGKMVGDKDLRRIVLFAHEYRKTISQRDELIEALRETKEKICSSCCSRQNTKCNTCEGNCAGVAMIDSALAKADGKS